MLKYCSRPYVHLISPCKVRVLISVVSLCNVHATADLVHQPSSYTMGLQPIVRAAWSITWGYLASLNINHPSQSEFLGESIGIAIAISAYSAAAGGIELLSNMWHAAQKRESQFRARDMVIAERETRELLPRGEHSISQTTNFTTVLWCLLCIHRPRLNKIKPK